MSQENLVIYSHSKGNIDYYNINPNYELYIDAIDLKTGKIEEKKIIQYTVHKNLEMYKVHDPKKRFEDFWVSKDHSLVVFDIEEELYKKASPIDISENPNKYCLVQKFEENDISLISCNEIEINYDPSVTEAADFTVEDYYTFCTADGIFVQDTLGVFTPVTEEALEDIKKLTNIYATANPRNTVINFSKDFKGGICALTSDPIKDSKYNFWWWKSETFKGNKTTKGRVYLYGLLPESAKNIFNFDLFNKQVKIEDILALLTENNISQEEVMDFAFKCQKISADIITQISESLDINTFEISEKVEKYRKLLEQEKDDFKKQEILNVMKKSVLSYLSETDIKLLLHCKILKEGQLFQLLGSKGLVLDPSGELTLIKSNFSKGLEPTEYFNAGFGARNGIIFRANKTAITGYLQRKMIYALESVELDLNLDYCGTRQTLDIKVTNDIAKRIINRYINFQGKPLLLTKENISDFIDKNVELFSPIYCKSKKICHRCYGLDYKLINSKYIGFIAAQSLSERLTQNMLSSFHVGGVVKPIILDFYRTVLDNTKTPEEVLTKVFSVKKKTEIFCNEDIKLIFSKDYYNMNTFVKEMETELPVQILICELEYNGKIYDIIYDGSVNIHIPFSIINEKTRYVLEYKKGSLFGNIIPETSSMELTAKKIISSVEGRAAIKDEKHLFMNIYKNMIDMGVINLVHFEILVSQLLRDKSNPNIPARLGSTWDPILVSIKQIPYLESWKKGLAFENFRKSVTNALLNEELEAGSILDRLL